MVNHADAFTYLPYKGLFCACESGDIDTLKEVLPHIPEAISDFVYEDENLLMW